MCDLFQGVTLRWCECKISKSSYLMWGGKYVQMNKIVSKIWCLGWNRGSLKPVNGIKINIPVSWCSRNKRVPWFKQQWKTKLWVCVCVFTGRDIHTWTEVVIWYDGSGRFITSVWWVFMQGAVLQQNVCSTTRLSRKAPQQRWRRRRRRWARRGKHWAGGWGGWGGRGRCWYNGVALSTATQH